MFKNTINTINKEVMKTSKAEIQKQIEYYLGDSNLAKDTFFREKITEHKDGYVKFEVFLNCNKIKKMGLDITKMKEACVGSTEVELSKDGVMVRRKDNKELPACTGSNKKRDVKAVSKQASKVEEKKVEDQVEEEVERDDQGRIIFKPVDFEDPKIIHFITQDRDAEKDENYKVNWKDLEVMVKEKFDKLKVVYSRADKYEGDLAISQSKLCKE